MKKSPSKKGVERRKKPRGRTASRPKAEARPEASTQVQAGIPRAAHPDVQKDVCRHCGNKIGENDKALFVEEEVGRIFCSEECISAYFSPDVQRLEKEYFRVVSDDDLTSKEREQYGHLRWITLQEPDEIWRQKTLSGDYRYTLISQFQPGSRTIWSVCVCLFLQGEPSFLYLAFTSRNAAAVDHYRRGERMERMRVGATGGAEAYSSPDSSSNDGEGGGAMDRLAPSWTDDETLRAQISQERKTTDIDPSEFAGFSKYLEPTLEEPDEVWSMDLGEPEPVRIFQFIRRFEEQGTGPFWYIIVAKETESDEELEVLDAFPTRDPQMVDSFRRGEQHVGEMEPPASSRVVH
ncbi:MAG: hypothetical protein A2X94_15790 [Bdellovibrionales bacterium GWB1_55_8]|nr:MAG: hypothetical protein A2X94_15790 [Bdellovibrionales bacterium GWB1_55_8]